MEFETEATVNEEEIDALGIKKKDSADIDTDADDTTIDPGLLEGEEEKEDTDRGFFLEDKEYEQQILNPYGDNDDYNM